jgi:hypothetical protein
MNINKAAVKRAVQFYQSAEALNRLGVAEFGGRWLGANEEMVGMLRSWGFNIYDPNVRQFGMLLVLRLARFMSGTQKGSCSRQEEE